MRRAGLLVWQAHQIAREVVRPGATTAEIDQGIESFFAQHNAIPLFKGVKGKVPFPAVTCISINEEVVHGIPGPRRLVEGDIVSIDTGCKLDGWCGDAAVTRPVGRIHPDVQRLLDVTKGTLDLAIDLMKVKTRWSQVAAQMEQYVHDAGFYVVETFVGHGIGREMHEDPQIPNYGKPGTGVLLEEGMVLAVEPMVNVGKHQVRLADDHWSIFSSDGSLAAHFEFTIAITADGPRILTPWHEATGGRAAA